MYHLHKCESVHTGSRLDNACMRISTLFQLCSTYLHMLRVQKTSYPQPRGLNLSRCWNQQGIHRIMKPKYQRSPASVLHALLHMYTPYKGFLACFVLEEHVAIPLSPPSQ
jgi:hypothetical protein